MLVVTTGLMAGQTFGGKATSCDYHGIIIGMNARFVGIAELDRAPSVAVVVDVMRAFTVAAWAFARGQKRSFLLQR